MNTVSILSFLAVIALGVFVFDVFLPWFNRSGAQWLADVARKWVTLKGLAHQVGGYVHNTAISYWIHFTDFSHNSGTWTTTVGPVANTYMTRRADAASTSITVIPLNDIVSSVAAQGFYLTSVDIWFEYTDAAPTSLDALIWKNTLPADTAVMVATAVAFAYDTGHDTAGERDNLDQHKMTLTLTTPVWIDNDELFIVELTSVNAAATTLDFYGARVNGTLRL